MIPETLPPTQLMSETVVALFRANGRLLEWGDTFTKPFNLTSARWQMLGAIACATHNLAAPHNMTAPQLAERMGVTRQGAQKQLNLLVADGLVEKRLNPTHQRSPCYQLSDAGWVLFRQISHAWEAHARIAQQHIAPADLQAACHVLHQLAALHTLFTDSGENDET